MRLLALSALVLAGCTAIFGLRAAPSVDRDDDGIEDSSDNCDEVPNPDQSDFDADAVGDACDTCDSDVLEDVDLDNIPDGCDGCIGNTEDVDGDGIDDGCDRCIEVGRDDDDDGIDDACDVCVFESGIDADGDLIDDNCDQCIGAGVDVDGDMIDDACDACVTTNRTDADGDGADDVCDACVAEFVGDTCGVCATCTCPSLSGATGLDEDGDGTDDGCDACKLVPSNDQIDEDGDGVGAACDVDDKVATDPEIFDGFNQPATGWYFQGNGWTLSSGRTKVDTGTTSYRMLGIAYDQFAVRTTFSAVLHNVAEPQVGVFVASTQVQPSPMSCECFLAPASLPSPLLKLRVSSGSFVTNQSLAVTFVPGARYRVELLTLKGELTCALVDSSNATLGSIALTLSSTGDTWYPGILVSSASATLYGYSVITRKQ